jgi:pilus assembly protein CpaC
MRRALAFSIALLALGVAAPSYAQRAKPPPGGSGGGGAGKPPPGGGGTNPGAAAASEETKEEDMGLAVGETKTIPANGVKNYSIGVEGIVDVRLTPSGDQFVIVGKKPGSTTLLLIKNDGSQVTWNIAVATRPPDVVYRELQQLLEGTTGVRVRRVGARFFVEGGVSTEGELRRITAIAALYPGQVENLVQVGSGAADRKLLIRVDFFFVQYDKSSSYTVGIGYPTALGGAGTGGDIVQSTFTFDFISKVFTTAQASVVNQPLPRLDIASRHGWAKVLKQSSVITSNGSEATWNSGGEANFRQFALQGTAGLQRISFGTNLTVLPRYDSQSREIEIALKSEVSDLTPPQTADLPGRNISKLDTLVNLKLGQALVLSGIKASSVIHSVSGLPGLSEIPVLGILFASHQNTTDDLETAVFIIPSVVETIPKSSMELIKSAISQYKDYSGDIDSVNTFDKTPPAAK